MMRLSKLISSAAKKKSAQRGMTLFELLIVLGILAMLATLIAPRVIGYMGRAKSDVATTQLSNIASALEFYYFDVGYYPSSEQTLKALVTAPTDTPSWRGPYLKEETGLIDPWGRAYLYQPNNDAETFVISTLGKDGELGGTGDNSDIEKK